MSHQLAGVCGNYCLGVSNKANWRQRMTVVAAYKAKLAACNGLVRTIMA